MMKTKAKPSPKKLLKPSPKKKPAAKPAGRPKMSTSRVEYRGAYIYQSHTKNSFRAIIEPPNYANEANLTWKGTTPTQKEWKETLDYIDVCKDYSVYEARKRRLGK